MDAVGSDDSVEHSRQVGESFNPSIWPLAAAMMQFLLRTLHIVLAIGPLLGYAAWLYAEGIWIVVLASLVGIPLGLLLGITIAAPLAILSRWRVTARLTQRIMNCRL